jgi:nucleoside-diphosphate-sugar epimerase
LIDTVVVTGGAGYVGSVVVGHLLLAGKSVMALDTQAGGGQALLGFHGHPRFSLVVADVRDDAALRAAFGRAQAVVHLAAVVGEPACQINPDAARAINFDGTRSALRCAEAAGLRRFVYVSTCSNYGVSSPETLADEDAPLRPLGVYAQSKVAAEQAVLAHDGGLPRIVMRFGTICGLSSRMRFDLLVNEMARDAVLGDAISVFAPDAWRPYLHIRDAARAVEWALGPGAPLGCVFNVVGENQQKRGLIDIVRRHYPSTAIELTDRAPDLRDYRVAGERVVRAGFSPGLTVENAFVEMASAVAAGAFVNPRSAEYAAAPVGG